jgi:uncharacterized protein (TIGR03083 family)
VSTEHGRAQDLLGAWALGACSAEEERAVSDHLARCPECAAEAELLSATAAALASDTEMFGRVRGRGPREWSPRGNGANGAGVTPHGENAWVAPGDRVDPPPGLRRRVLDSIRPRRAPAPSYAEPYAAEVATLDALLAEIAGPEVRPHRGHDSATDKARGISRDGVRDKPYGEPVDAARHDPGDDPSGILGDDLSGPFPPSEAPAWATRVIYDWSVQDVVAHLAATDGLTAAALGVAVENPPRPGDDLDSRTDALIAYERGRTPWQTRTAWRSQADLLCERLRATDRPGSDVVEVVGGHMRVADLMVARATETWVHADDIARAVGRTLPVPLPQYLHPIADLGVRGLPKALALRGGGRVAASASLVLTGPGGGEWLVPLDPDAPREPAVHLELDVVEFCFLAGGRRDAETLDVAVRGDAALARELLAAAPMFSGR